MGSVKYFTLFILIINCSCYALIDQQPQQIHLSLGQNVGQMIVTWITFNATSISTVEYGPEDEISQPLPKYLNVSKDKFPYKVTGTSEKFIDGGDERREMFIHRAIIKPLNASTRYYYHVGSDDGWSAIYWFKTLKGGVNWSPTIAIYGDMGNFNGKSIPRLQQEVSRSSFDAIIHVGDLAYDLDRDNARVGDAFLRQLEPIAAYVPYQTVVGNHENAYNFSNYDARFTMVNGANGVKNNHFYSFDIGPVHFIAFSTEYYFYVNYGWTQIANQFAWLESDLIEATKPQNRKVRPWIVTLGHRPMYCSTDDRDDCKNKESIVRKGLPILQAYGLEDLFYKYAVDVEIWAHEHTYERMWPLYDYKVYNGSKDNPYTNPTAPVHIITGSAGCDEYLDRFVTDPPEWSAFRLSDYGYTRLHAINASHLAFEQVSDDKGGAIIDKFTLIKDKHDQYPKREKTRRRNWSQGNNLPTQ